MTNRKSLVLAAGLAVASALALPANAAVIVNPNDPAPGQHTMILDSVTFTVTANGTVGVIYFEDFYSSNATSCGNHVSSSFTASVNGGAVFAFGANTCTGTFGLVFGGIDPNDLFINVATADEFGVSIGDTVTIQGTQVWSDSNLPSFNAGFAQVGRLMQEFDGAIDLSADTQLNAVPAPATVALLGIGLAGLGIARRRKAQ